MALFTSRNVRLAGALLCALLALELVALGLLRNDRRIRLIYLEHGGAEAFHGIQAGVLGWRLQFCVGLSRWAEPDHPDFDGWGGGFRTDVVGYAGSATGERPKFMGFGMGTTHRRGAVPPQTSWTLWVPLPLPVTFADSDDADRPARGA